MKGKMILAMITLVGIGGRIAANVLREKARDRCAVLNSVASFFESVAETLKILK